MYSNLSKCIFIVEDNCGFLNTFDLYSTENFVHVPVESSDELAHPEESILVLEAIFIFPKTDALFNFVKLLPFYYSTKTGGAGGYRRCLSTLQKMNHGRCIQDEEKRG